MNLRSVVVFLSICLLVPSVVDLVRVKRDLLQFGKLIDCATGNPNSWYWDYGCLYGAGANGNTAVDDLDRCCQVHDDCYGNATETCKGWMWTRTGHIPVTLRAHDANYDYQCDAATKIKALKQLQV